MYHLTRCLVLGHNNCISLVWTYDSSTSWYVFGVVPNGALRHVEGTPEALSFSEWESTPSGDPADYYFASVSGGEPSGGGVHDVSQAGLNFIAGYEGYSATTYKDVAGLPTIGYGHLIKSGESFGTLSKNAALQLLRKDASFAVNAVNKYVKVPLSQNQFDALQVLRLT